MLCKTCFLYPESQQHLFECNAIRQKLSLNWNNVNYEMIYSNVKDQEKITKVYHIVLQARKDMLKNEK